jgi:hypothetical protein
VHHRVLQLTLTQPPTAYGVTHWSSRLLAAALAAEGTPISHVTIARIWHRFGVQPRRAQTFKFSTDPELEGKIRDVVGLYLHPRTRRCSASTRNRRSGLDARSPRRLAGPRGERVRSLRGLAPLPAADQRSSRDPVEHPVQPPEVLVGGDVAGHGAGRRGVRAR